MKAREVGRAAFGLFIIASAFGAALNLLWDLGIRDATLLGIVSGIVLMGTVRMLDGPPAS